MRVVAEGNGSGDEVSEAFWNEVWGGEVHVDH